MIGQSFVDVVPGKPDHFDLLVLLKILESMPL